MELEILRLINDYSRNSRIIDTRYIEKLVEIVTTSKSLNNYVRKILWLEKLDKKINGAVIASYSLMSKSLKVNLSSLQKTLEQPCGYDYLFNGIECFFYKNLMLTQCILHELEHANQNKMVDLKGDDLETKLLSASLMISKALYYKFYEQIPSERLAEIKSFRVIDTILEQSKEYTPNLSRFEKALFIEQKLRGYLPGWNSIECPTKVYLFGRCKQNLWKKFDFFDSDSNKMQEKVNLNYQLSERLTYGLPISYGEYFKVAESLYSIKSEFLTDNDMILDDNMSSFNIL